MKRIVTQTITALFIATMFLSSCSKKDDHEVCGGPPTSSGTNETERNRIKQMLAKLPVTKITGFAERYAAMHSNDHSVSKSENGGWNFSDGNGGTWNFSNPSGLSYSNTENTIFIPYSSFGVNTSSGGTVVAGSSSLDINYTFCFSANEAALGLDLYDLNGSDFTGLSLIIGVSADFDALANIDSTENPFDFFRGIAFYVVYDSPAEGDYGVASWLNGLTDLNVDSKKAFAFIFDFQNAKLYLSTSGTVNVTGGSMNYDGEYLEITGFFDETGTFDWDNLSYYIVPGFGAMGCN